MKTTLKSKVNNKDSEFGNNFSIKSNEYTLNQGVFIKEIEKPLFDGTVLVCDDDPSNIIVIHEYLKRVGLKTVVATNGYDGVKRVRERAYFCTKNIDRTTGYQKNKQFGLVLMDIHMPVMDGLEASIKISEIDCNIPIVALTTDSTFQNSSKYNGSGITDYLNKPFLEHELWNCLLKYFTPLNKKKPHIV